MYSQIFPNSVMSIFPSLTPDKYTRAVGSLAGASIKLMNFTNYDVKVSVGADQVDLIPAYQYLIMPNEPDLFLTIVTPESTNYIYPQSYIAAKTFDDVLSYEIGSLIHFMSVSPGDTVNVSGDMTITNTPNVFVNGGSMDVNITGNPTMNLAVGTSVAISGTPAVTLMGASNNVNIGNTPTVNIGGTVTVQLTASGNSVNIANVPSVAIQGTPSMNVANTSIPITNYAGGALNIAGQVNIGNTPSVSISGTPNVAIASGTVNATIQNASLNSNITNALLQTGSMATSNVVVATITNLAAGGVAGWFQPTLPLSMYDSFIIVVKSTTNPMSSYQVNYESYGYLNTYNNIPPSAAHVFTSQYTNATVFVSEYMPIRGTSTTPELVNAIWVSFSNISGSTITSDSLVITIYAKYASTNANVTNSSLATNSNVTNSILQTGVTAYIGSSSTTITNLANGATVGLTNVIGETSLYDEVIVLLQANDLGNLVQNRYTLTNPRTGMAGQVWTSPGTSNPMTWNTADLSPQFCSTMPTPLYYSNGTFANMFSFSLKNISGATIASDTVRLYVYAKYSTYSPPTASPTVAQGVNLNPSFTGNAPVTLLTIENAVVIKYIINVYNGYSSALPANAYIDFFDSVGNYYSTLFIGGLNAGYPLAPFTIDLSPGVASNGGISMLGSNFGSANVGVSCLAIL